MSMTAQQLFDKYDLTSTKCKCGLIMNCALYTNHKFFFDCSCGEKQIIHERELPIRE